MALTPPFSIATLNVRGLAARRRQSQLLRLLTDQDIDVLAVQETKVDGEEETGSMVRRFTDRYYAVVSHAIGTSAGCVFFFFEKIARPSCAKCIFMPVRQNCLL